MAIKLEVARGEFTSLGGLSLFNEMMLELNFYKRLKDYLPGKSPLRVRKNFEKFRSMVLGSVAGAECLDDMDDFGEDAGFRAACDHRLVDARRAGDFLRSFEQWHPRHLNEVLADIALKMRLAMFKEDDRFILDIDSTLHHQYSKKMEELGWGYDQKTWGLSSLQAFDNRGFQYWMDVKGGSVHTSNGVPTVIQRVFRKVPRKMRRYLRADAGMCNFDVMRACLDNDVSFVLTMPAHMHEPMIPRVTNWNETKDTYFKGKKAEIGTAIYYPKNLDRDRPLRVVLVRVPKDQPELYGDFNLRNWDFHAWVTTIPESEMQPEKLVNFYNGRGNCENFIREGKNGFDLHHFPCKKLLANKVYGLIAAFAHNLMRMASWTLDKTTPRFSKMTRFRMVYLAGQVVKKARYTIIRLSAPKHKELTDWISKIQKQFSTG